MALPGSSPELDRAAVRAAVTEALRARTPAVGAVAFLAVPGRVDDFAGQLFGIFASLGRPFGDHARAKFRAGLLERLSEGFRASPHALVRVHYETDPGKPDALDWKIETLLPPPEARYEGDAGGPPLLDEVPDARLRELAGSLGAPGDVTYLDVGAGPGRNALALARLGHPTDAVEPLPTVAEALAARAKAEGAALRVACGDFWDPAFALPRPRYRLVACTEIERHLRGVGAVRRLFHRIAGALEPSGAALLRVFVARDGYVPDPVTREVAEALSCPLFTREELEDAAYSLPLRLESDEGALAFERAHRAEWPPSPWYEAWASGQRLFGVAVEPAPIALRWLVYRGG